MIRKLTETQAPPSAAAPMGLCVLIILYHRYLWIFLIYSLYIPYILPSYVPCIFPCVFLNLWSQQKTSPYRKTSFIFFSPDFTPFIFLVSSFMIFSFKLMISQATSCLLGLAEPLTGSRGNPAGLSIAPAL